MSSTHISVSSRREPIVSMTTEHVFDLIGGMANLWQEKYRRDENTRIAIPMELIIQLRDYYFKNVTHKCEPEELTGIFGIPIYPGYESAIVIYDSFDYRKDVIRCMLINIEPLWKVQEK